MTDDSKCRLCGRDSELRESHIIPRSIIKMIRDESLNNRFIELHDGQDRIIQDGPKEYLLCDDCEQKIGRYEKYFVEAVHYNKHGTDKKHDSKHLLIENLDYKKMKLFFLSLLWRMSISSRPEFEVVSIEGAEERIREMILKDEPGDCTEYSVCAIAPLFDDGIEEGYFLGPFVSKRVSETIIRIVIGGILCSISTARQGTSLPQRLLLNESGSWIMPLRDFSSIPLLQEYIERHFNK
ncbi:MAG: hypothetical protein ISS79_10310 [Phycisphaerae bacterium]|nr:hypothetical protein [Phycisphaerae bacterium]